MKKKRVLTIALCTVLMASTLSGCTMPDIPFLNKGGDEGEDLPTDDLPVEDTRASVIEGVVANVGDTVTFDDLATIDEFEAGNVLQKVIGQDDGSIGESYTFEQAGVYTLTLMIEFIDGTVWDGQVTVDVSEKTLDLPDELSNNIATKGWATVNFGGYDIDTDDYSLSDVLVSYVYENFELHDANGIFGSDVTLADLGHPVYSTVVLTDEQLSKIRVAGVPPMTYDINVMKAMNIMRNSAVSMDESEAAKFVNAADWIAQMYNRSTTATVVTTDKFIYDTEGASYQVNVVQYTVDFVAYGGESYTYAGPILIKSSDGRTIMFMDNTAVMDYSIDLGISRSEEGEQVEFPDTYDAFVEFIKGDQNMISALAGLAAQGSSVDDVTSRFDSVVYNMIIGDVTPLLPVPEEDTIVSDPGEEEDPEESGVVADVFVPYAQQHPEIYAWPNNDTKYRRWVYLVDKSTNFVSTIINPDGTSLISGVTTEDDWRIDVDPGGSQVTPGATPPADDDTHTLSSQYSTYTIHTAGMPGATLDKEQSTSGRSVINYGGNRYFIETVRTSQIQAYMANCLYPTSEFKDGSFVVMENDSKRQETSIGHITPYTIGYTDASGTYQVRSYMEVYNVYNDYLVIYGDKIPVNDTILRNLMWNMVQLEE